MGGSQRAYSLGGAGGVQVPLPPYPGELEWAIERAERLHPGSPLVLPSWERIERELTPVEVLHLELFLLARGVEGRGATSVTGAQPGVGWPGYIGSPHPRALLLGDRHNPRFVTPDSYRAPFGPWRGCGPWLLGTLERAQWVELGVANAGEVDVRELITVLGGPPVVALGRRAQSTVEEQMGVGFHFGVLSHPAYASRFAHSHQMEYGRALLRVASTQEDMGGWRGKGTLML